MAANPRKRPRHIEAEHGRALVSWWETACKRWGLTPNDLVHVPNGGARNPRAGALLKAEGVRAGYPDYVLDVANGGYHGLRLELKPPQGDAPRGNQLEHLERLEKRGFCVRIAYGRQQALQQITEYLTGVGPAGP